jgi:hypothetical protein
VIKRIVRQLPTTVTPLTSIEKMRVAALDLAKSATDAVQSVRSAFAEGVAPLQSVGSGSVAPYVTMFSRDPLGANIVKSTAQLGLKTSTAGSSVAPPKPELDSTEIVEGPGGVFDQFSVKLTVSISDEHIERVAWIKVMRAKLGPLDVPRPAVSALSLNPPVPGSALEKNSIAAFRVDDIGVGNKMTAFIMDDPASNSRAVISPDSLEFRAPLPPLNNNRGVATAGLLTIDGADRSVLENLKFYLNRRLAGALDPPPQSPIEIGGRIGVNVLKGNGIGASRDSIVQSPNSLSFTQIGRIDMTSPGVHRVGDFIEATFVDRAVVYGTSFVYYAVCVGPDGVEGPRSRLVDASVMRVTPPKPPEVLHSVIGGRPRFTIKCPSGADHVEVFRSGRSVIDSVRLGSDTSLVTQGPATKVGQFWHLSDIGLGSDGSTTFVDTDVMGGDRLSYRFYTVDSYGLKCQTPFSCSIWMPEHGQTIPLPVPSITVEQAPGQPAVSVKMRVDDPRVAGFTVQRREVTVHERSVHQANQPELMDLGATWTTKRAGSRRSPTLLDADWPTYLPASGGSASFVDNTVRLDRRYQYAVGAIDKRGNKTLMVGSQPVMVYSKVIVDPPTAFSAKIEVVDGRPTGVLLTWSGGTNDFSPNSIVGDQDVLAATSVRSVFQVERRQLGTPFWDAMPATSESYFRDVVSGDQNPAFRPAYPVPGGEYEYRVLAMQSGGFISPRSDVLYIPVVPPPEMPEVVWVRTTPVSSNPFCVIVSWDMDGEFVEHWEVERAVTNKVFAEQITTMDSQAARDLEYSRVANITPEASRARSLSERDFTLDKAVYVGNRFYVDPDVHRANSYFYRVRSVGRLGTTSQWTYAGLFIKSAAFDSKFYSTLSDDAKISLTQDSRPIVQGTTPIVSLKTTITTTLKSTSFVKR